MALQVFVTGIKVDNAYYLPGMQNNSYFVRKGSGQSVGHTGIVANRRGLGYASVTLGRNSR
jgi:hypothetical protein